MRGGCGTSITCQVSIKVCNMFKTILLLSVVAMASAGLYGGVLVGPSTHGLVLNGPKAEGAVNGPDGSHIRLHGASAGKVIAHPVHGGSVAGAVVPGHIVGHVGHVGHWDDGLLGVGLVDGHWGLLHDEGQYHLDHNGW